jgi:diacylglycerol kinase
MVNFLKSFRYAFQGIAFAWQGRNFRVQVGAGILVTVLGFWLEISTTEWLVVLTISGLVLAFEVMNSAIEHLVNMISPEFHPLAGKVKDLAAGAVLLLSISAVIIGLIIFVPYFILLLNKAN